MAPLRVAIIVEATLTVVQGECPGGPTYDFPERGQPRHEIEQQINDRIRQLVAVNRYKPITLKLIIKTDGGQTMAAPFTITGGRFESARRSLADAFLARARNVARERERLQHDAELLEGYRRRQSQ